MNTSAKKGVGARAWELQQRPDPKINSIDLQRQIHKGNANEDSFENQVMIAVERGQKDLDGDFFVVVLIKKERILKNVVRQYFFPRKSCPTPEYDQIVYHFIRKSEELKFIWVIPDKQSTIDLPLMKSVLPAEQKELIQFAEDFNSGKLDRLCDRFNKPK